MPVNHKLSIVLSACRPLSMRFTFFYTFAYCYFNLKNLTIYSVYMFIFLKKSFPVECELVTEIWYENFKQKGTLIHRCLQYADFWSFLINFIWWLHSTATHLSYNTHMLQAIAVLITVLFQLVIFHCHWKVLKEVQKHNHKYHTSFQLGCVTKLLLFHGMLTVVAGLPCTCK